MTQPERVDPDTIADLSGNAAEGELVFHASGCASCHAAPDAEGDAKLVLSGGQRFPSPFGTFLAPNISSDPDVGIGGWSDEEIVSAVMYGTSPNGRHYYPAFPYVSYRRAEPQDVVDLAAFLRTLPADPTPSDAHELGFPYNIRRGIGFWKLLYVS
ncbi:MAG: cytochrome c, partial [Pseudomonadota bacterium]